MDPLVEQASDCQRDVSMACPTCRAEQAWSDTCRRCRCDLTDLRAVWQRHQGRRRSCLAALRSGDWERALQLARDCVSLHRSADSLRLLAVCHLLRGDWRDAWQAARAAD